MECGCAVVTKSSYAKCDPCRREHEAARSAAKAARRRAAAEQAGERISPRAIFERDGYRCYLCGFRTVSGPTTRTDPARPTLEHVVPVSRGGLHTADNLRTAHRICNMWKGDRAVAPRAFHDRMVAMVSTGAFARAA